MTSAYDLDEWSPQGPVVELADAHSWELIRQTSFGRLAVSVENQPQIFPVDYYSDGDGILFRTAAGTKLDDLVLNHSVAFEIDQRGATESWSVVVDGIAVRLTDREEIALADRVPLPPWIPTAPYVYVRITATTIRGRRFVHALLAEAHRDPGAAG